MIDVVNLGYVKYPRDRNVIKNKIKMLYKNQDTYAQKLGISRKAVSRRLNGNSTFNLHELDFIINIEEIEFVQSKKEVI
jgi:hypothetical protein